MGLTIGSLREKKKKEEKIDFKCEEFNLYYLLFSFSRSGLLFEFNY